MKRIPLLCILALLCISVQLTWGQTVELARWNFTNATGDWGTSPFPPSATNTNVTVNSGLTRGSGLTTSGQSAGTAWGANGFFDNVSPQNADSAIALGNFITFTIKANTGFKVSITQIAACNLRRSPTGPGATQWQYSLDGTNFTNIGTTITLGLTSSSGNAVGAIDLSGIAALQNVPYTTTVKFRVVMWGATADNGTWYFNAGPSNLSLIFNGTTASIPLPLQLLSFNGKQENNVNRLDWVTAQEKNVAHFELERGIDGHSFSKIAEIKSRGNSSAATNQYSYKDADAATMAYYRLKMVDADGSANYSDIVALRNSTVSGNVRVYPNPADNTLFLEGFDGKASYTVTDATGREVIAAHTTAAVGAATTVNIAGLPQGIYFLRLTDEQKTETIRFVKK